jgi:hypothetical protein
LSPSLDDDDGHPLMEFSVSLDSMSPPDDVWIMCWGMDVMVLLLLTTTTTTTDGDDAKMQKPSCHSWLSLSTFLFEHI